MERKGPGPTDPLVRAEPPFDWYRTPTEVPRRVETPERTPITLDPDIALWPVTPLSRWPFIGPPTEGMWPVGWMGVDATGTIYTCTVGGEPGTWAAQGGSSGQTWTPVSVASTSGHATHNATAGELILASDTNGGISINLPATPPAGTQVGAICIVDPDTGVHFLTTDGSTIQGATETNNGTLFWPWQVAILVFTGTEWAWLAPTALSLSSAGTGVMGAGLSTLAADGSRRTTLDDGSGNMAVAGALRALKATLTGGPLATPLLSTTGAYAMDGTESLILADGAVTLPDPTSPANRGAQFTIKDNGGGTASVLPFGAETIDGHATIALSTAFDAVTVSTDSSAWYVISQVAATVL